MTRYPFYFRLILLACILSSLTLIVFPKGPFHLMLEFLASGLFVSGVVLMYLRKTGRTNWNGPNWGQRFHTWPGSKRVLTVFPAICASMVPILFSLHRKLGLTDGHLGLACGILLGCSIVALKFRKSGSACCLPEEASTTQQ
ncbi:MAG: hypothetical protein ACYCOX_07780 [Acidobacteriaceae bacterium]